MSNVKEIETAVIKLPPNDFSAFAKWFEEYQAKVWDNKIAKDFESGRLNELLAEVEVDFEKGNCQEL